MPNIIQILLLLMSLSIVSSCGVKGKLKTPERIEKEAERKTQQEAKKKEKEESTQVQTEEKK